MEQSELDKIVEDHRLWVNHRGGQCADLSGLSLKSANLKNANLEGAILENSDLSGANLESANLKNANLSRANLSHACFYSASLRNANLSHSNLMGANLRNANLINTDLSQTKGLLNAADYLTKNFETTALGIIVYKKFTHQYLPPKTWKIAQGSILTEVVNPDRCTALGSGIHVATLRWIHENTHPEGDIWKCLIYWIDLADTVVPYNTDGKIRTSRLLLLEKIPAVS